MNFITEQIHNSWNDAEIKVRVIIPVMITLTVITSFAGVSFYQSEKNNLITELNYKGQSISASLSAFAINNMATEKLEKLSTYSSELIASQKTLHHVVFYKNNSPILTINSGSMREKLRPETLKYFKSSVYSPDSNEQVGFVRISLSTQQIEDHLATRIFQITVVAVIIVIISTILLSWLLEKVIANPLERLSHKIQMITHGRFNSRVSFESFGEIGHLFKDINALRIRLKRKQDELFSDVKDRKNKNPLNLQVSGHKALIIDDDKLILMQAQKLLEKNEMKVLLANSGKEALQVLNEYSVDLILLDLVMPEMSGFDVLNVIQSNTKLAEIPVIVCSSITDKEYIVKALNSGAIDYVIKPFDNKEFMARVKTHLRTSLREKELEKIVERRLESLRNI